MNTKGILLVLVLAMSGCVQQAETAHCVAVHDGDTFEIEHNEIVRLIGIDAPELSEPGGDLAKEYLSSLILGNRVILIEGAEKKDSYGRLLRYVYTGATCVNEEMLRQGYAEARYLPENDPNREYYLQLEIEAENIKAGLWGSTIFQHRSNLMWEDNIPVICWKDADKYYGQYVIVEGTIVNTYNSGEVCFLNFHSDWKQYLTAIIFASDFPAFPEQPEVYYLGKNVLIIGIVKDKGKPEIVVKTPDQIKIVR